eukprot:RCo026391
MESSPAYEAFPAFPSLAMPEDLWAYLLTFLHCFEVAAVSRCGDSRLLSIGEQELRRWPRPRVFTGHTDFVYGVAISPSGRRVVSASKDRTVRVWEICTGEEVLTLRGHGGEVRACQVSPDGRHLLTGSDDMTAKLWNFHTGEVLLTYQAHTFSVNTVAFSPSGKYLATGSGDSTARVWELS